MKPHESQVYAEVLLQIDHIPLNALITFAYHFFLLRSFFSQQRGTQTLLQKSVHHGSIQAVNNHMHRCSPYFDTERSERASSNPGMITLNHVLLLEALFSNLSLLLTFDNTNSTLNKMVSAPLSKTTIKGLMTTFVE